MSGELLATFKEHESAKYTSGMATNSRRIRVFSNLHRVSENKYYVWGTELKFGSAYEDRTEFFYSFYKFTGGPGNDYWRGIQKKDGAGPTELGPNSVSWFCRRLPLTTLALEDWLGDRLINKMFPAYKLLGVATDEHPYMHYMPSNAQPAFRRNSVFGFESELCGTVVAEMLDGDLIQKVPEYVDSPTPLLSALIRMPKGHKRDHDPILALSCSPENTIRAVSNLLDFGLDHGGVAAQRRVLDEFFESDVKPPFYGGNMFGELDHYEIAQLVPRFYKSIRLTPPGSQDLDEYLHFTRTREPIVFRDEAVHSLSELANVLTRNNVAFQWNGLEPLYEFGLDNQRTQPVH